MEILKKSFFKNNENDKNWLENWVYKMEQTNQRTYKKITLNTSLGNTQVYGVNIEKTDLETLIIFPGARTSSLFWDFDQGLNHLKNIRIFMIETNGLPNLSDGNTPDIKSNGYGIWAGELLELLAIDKCYITGASFGGLICMKLCIEYPEKVKAAFLLNPGCLQTFSFKLKNLYYNILPLLSPNNKNVLKFLNNAVFYKPNHQLSTKAEELIVQYELFAITRYQDNTQKPYNMGIDLLKVKTPVYLLLGNKDLLFPYKKSIENAKKRLTNLKDVQVYENVGHGIETYSNAKEYISECIKRLHKTTS